MDDKSDDILKNIFWIAPILVMSIGFLPMPYGYYNLSRIVVCVCSIYFAYNLYKQDDITFVWIFGLLAVLYNPIIPIHLYEKKIWMIVNILTAVLFITKKNRVN